jgi:hypothetical protein
MNYETITKIDPKRVQDMIIGAFEGGSNYWCHTANLINPKPESLPKDGVVWWGNSKKNVFDDPQFRVEIIDDENETHILDPLAIAKGLQIMATKYSGHFSDMITENDDATTSDVFLQCCLFGEVIYG